MSILAKANILVLAYPSWTGYGLGDPGQEGYYNALNAQSQTIRQNYGAFIGARYAAYKNIIWVLGGDYNPPNSAVVTDIATGIMSAHPASTLFSVDMLDGDSPLTNTTGWTPSSSLIVNGVNNVYTDIAQGHPYTYVNCKLESQRTDFPGVPFFQKEGGYQNGPGQSNQLVRSQTWTAMLGGASGYHWGSSPAWLFATGWQADFASTRAALDSEVSNAFFSSHHWELLVPDWGNKFLTNGASYSNGNFAGAAYASDGSWGAVYVPTQESLNISFSVFSGPVTVSWMDPTNGKQTSLGTFENTATQSFTPQGTNAAADGDWVLLFSSCAAATSGH
jgi:hypothetical protein